MIFAFIIQVFVQSSYWTLTQHYLTGLLINTNMSLSVMVPQAFENAECGWKSLPQGSAASPWRSTHSCLCCASFTSFENDFKVKNWNHRRQKLVGHLVFSCCDSPLQFKVPANTCRGLIWPLECNKALTLSQHKCFQKNLST